jgi:ribosomal protein S18 acetylase RimI-like enzyme
MADFGDAVIVPSSMAKRHWGNMLQFGEVMGELTDPQSVSDKLLGSKNLLLLFLVMICVPLAFFLLQHVVWMSFDPAYRRLGQADRLMRHFRGLMWHFKR